jgi:hypothetical protein
VGCLWGLSPLGWCLGLESPWGACGVTVPWAGVWGWSPRRTPVGLKSPRRGWGLRPVGWLAWGVSVPGVQWGLLVVL